ncbi:MAG: uracil-DNA glycosylase [Planctomycetota bacterium]|nr:MAG: uracil-DNA glycosylase [Planctomycetota bacterium]
MTNAIKVNPEIDASWLEQLKDEFQSDYFKKLKGFLLSEKQNNQVIYPPGKLIFNAFNLCPFDKVKVVILGQDPYHGAGQAHGLCFSVPDKIPAPPSLKNIVKELESDLGQNFSNVGNLEKWAKAGVLLLNSSLTVRAHNAGSHFGQGWEVFTDAVVKRISNEKESVVFLLWGSPAQKKGSIVDSSKHCILKSPHPSPLSAYRGFVGCKHFSKTNDYLISKNLKPINWTLDSVG